MDEDMGKDDRRDVGIISVGVIGGIGVGIGVGIVYEGGAVGMGDRMGKNVGII